MYKENGLEYARECDCGKIKSDVAGRKLRFANIPETFRGIMLKDIRIGMYRKPESKEVMKGIGQTLKYFVENVNKIAEQGRGLFMWSEAKGSGKTMSAVALANELIERGRQVKFCTSMQILNEIKASWDDDKYNESDLLKALSDVEFLIIDDFGTENVKEWIEDRFYQIINTRYIDRKVTFFTSNYKIENLPYDERIGNRISERCYRVHFPEESVRTNIAQYENEQFRKEVFNCD